MNLVQAKNGKNTQRNNNIDYLEVLGSKSQKASGTSKNNNGPELRRDITFGDNGKINEERYVFVETEAHLLNKKTTAILEQRESRF